MIDTIAAWENDKDVVELEYADRKRVYTALRQTHLSKLDKRGVVEYESGWKTIQLTGNTRLHGDVTSHGIRTASPSEATRTSPSNPASRTLASISASRPPVCG